MTKTKIGKSRPLPIVTASHFCGGITIDVATGCPSLIQIYNTLQRPTVPFSVDQLSIFIGVTAMRGKYSFRLMLRHIESDDVVYSETGELQCKDPLFIVQILRTLGRVTFNHAGIYVLELSLDGHVILSRSLNVVTTEAVKKNS